MKRLVYLIIAVALCITALNSFDASARKRMRDMGITYGVFKTGANNAITDVPGVTVGHRTLDDGERMHTGVTAIIPHQGNVFRQKCPAAVYVGNGFGKLAGSTQIQELGTLETPIILTNTLNVAEGMRALVTYTMTRPGNETVGSVNAVVGETNDGVLNDVRARYVTEQNVLEAIFSAHSGPVEEGNVGAGRGTVAFGLKGGIGTASRVLPASMGGYTVGVLVQTNYGGVLKIAGVEIGQLMGRYSYRKEILEDVTCGSCQNDCGQKTADDSCRTLACREDVRQDADGSCVIIVATDAPVDARNLERMAERAFMGLAQTGGIAANGSGDYVIAFSNCPGNLVDESVKPYTPTLLHNDDMSGLFQATIEATAESIWKSLFMAETLTGKDGRTVEALDTDWAAKVIRKAQQ